VREKGEEKRRDPARPPRGGNNAHVWKRDQKNFQKKCSFPPQTKMVFFISRGQKKRNAKKSLGRCGSKKQMGFPDRGKKVRETLQEDARGIWGSKKVGKRDLNPAIEQEKQTHIKKRKRRNCLRELEQGGNLSGSGGHLWERQDPEGKNRMEEQKKGQQGFR